MDDFSRAFLGRNLVETRIAHEGAVRPLDKPDIIGNRRHFIVRVAKGVVLRTLTRVGRVTNREDYVDAVAHAFFPEPTVTPARRSIILTIIVKSVSPPKSAFVVSHRSSTALITALGTSNALASSTHSWTSLSISAVAKP